MSVPLLSYGQGGEELKNIPDREKKIAFLNEVVALKGEPKTICNDPKAGSSLMCHLSHDEDEENITVLFSRDINHQTVVAVQRDKIFNIDPKPSMASITVGLYSKYQKDKISYEQNNSGNVIVGWFFDPAGKVIDRGLLKNKGLVEAAGLPFNVRQGDGIGLNIYLGASNNNPLIVGRMTITLYSGDKLFKSVAQGKASYVSLKSKNDEDEAAQGNVGAGKTKF